MTWDLEIRRSFPFGGRSVSLTADTPTPPGGVAAAARSVASFAAALLPDGSSSMDGVVVRDRKGRQRNDRHELYRWEGEIPSDEGPEPFAVWCETDFVRVVGRGHVEYVTRTGRSGPVPGPGPGPRSGLPSADDEGPDALPGVTLVRAGAESLSPRFFSTLLGTSPMIDRFASVVVTPLRVTSAFKAEGVARPDDLLGGRCPVFTAWAELTAPLTGVNPVDVLGNSRTGAAG